MSLSSVKSQVDQIYVLLKKLLNNQQNTNTQQVDLTPISNGITQLKTDYLQDVLDKVRQQNTQFTDIATGWIPFFDKVSGIHTGIFDAATGISARILDISGSINDNSSGLKSIFDKASNIHTGLFDSVSGISGRILDVSASISDNSNGLKSIFDKANSIHTGLYDSTTGLAVKILGLSGSINDETNGLKSIFDKSSNIHTGLFDVATGLSKKVLDISGSVDTNSSGLKDIKTKLNVLDGITTATSLLNAGSYRLQDIWNRADNAATNITSIKGTGTYNLQDVWSRANSAATDAASIKGTGVKNLQDVYTAVSNIPTTSKNSSYLSLYGANVANISTVSLTSRLIGIENSFQVNREINFDTAYDTGIYVWDNTQKYLTVGTDSLSQINYSLSATVPAYSNFVLYIVDSLPTPMESFGFITARNNSGATSEIFVNGSLNIQLQKNRKYKLLYLSTTGALSNLLLTINSLVP